MEYPLLLDGATGTNLIMAGMKSDDRVADYILNNPDVMSLLQRNYIEAGSRLLLTPTFGVNSIKYGASYEELNIKLVALTAKTVKESGKDVMITGEMSPCGLFAEPLGNSCFNDIYNIFAQQARVLDKAGVDAIALSTMYSLSETRIALLAVRENTDKPVIACVTVDENGKTMSGNDVLACVALLQSMGAAAVGLNCSTGPIEMLEQIKRISEINTIPIIAKPNAGMDVNKYLSPEIFAFYIGELMKQGASIVGGCCGTDPEYIKLINNEILPMYSKEYFNSTIIRNKEEHIKNETFNCATGKNLYVLNKEVDLSEELDAQTFIDDIFEIERTSFDAAYLRLDTEDDVDNLIQNSYMIDIPICISSEDHNLIDRTVREYCGTVLIDFKCEVNEEKLEYYKNYYGSLIV